MADQDDGQSFARTKIGQQVQNLRLDCDIQRCGGLVRHQNPGPSRQGQRDGHPLTQPAGQLVRIGIDHMGRGQRSPPVSASASTHPRYPGHVGSRRWFRWPRTVIKRIKRAHRILEDHRQRLRPRRHGHGLALSIRSTARPIDLQIAPLNVGIPGQQTHQRLAGNGFARAAFADQAQDLARDQVKSTPRTASTGPLIRLETSHARRGLAATPPGSPRTAQCWSIRWLTRSSVPTSSGSCTGSDRAPSSRRHGCRRTGSARAAACRADPPRNCPAARRRARGAWAVSGRSISSLGTDLQELCRCWRTCRGRPSPSWHRSGARPGRPDPGSRR